MIMDVPKQLPITCRRFPASSKGNAHRRYTERRPSLCRGLKCFTGSCGSPHSCGNCFSDRDRSKAGSEADGSCAGVAGRDLGGPAEACLHVELAVVQGLVEREREAEELPLRRQPDGVGWETLPTEISDLHGRKWAYSERQVNKCEMQSSAKGGTYDSGVRQGSHRRHLPPLAVPPCLQYVQWKRCRQLCSRAASVCHRAAKLCHRATKLCSRAASCAAMPPVCAAVPPSCAHMAAWWHAAMPSCRQTDWAVSPVAALPPTVPPEKKVCVNGREAFPEVPVHVPGRSAPKARPGGEGATMQRRRRLAASSARQHLAPPGLHPRPLRALVHVEERVHPVRRREVDDVRELVEVCVVVLPFDGLHTGPRHAQPQGIEPQPLHPLEVLLGHRDVGAEATAVGEPRRALHDGVGPADRHGLNYFRDQHILSPVECDLMISY
eukprot:gene9915-biopygen368